LAQTQLIAQILKQAGQNVEVVTISTSGDRSQGAQTPIAEVGVGVFTSALREALLNNQIDIAVHSYKDLPTAGEPGIVLAAVPGRADARDALIARDGLTLAGLPAGSTVGTGSPRRSAQLRALGLGLEVVPIRGNIDTRMRKVFDGQLDAVVLAKAGLDRVGQSAAITEVLDPIQMLPAPAQGALAVECRQADGDSFDVDTEHLLRSIVDDKRSRCVVTAERVMLATLEAGCSAPVGALAEIVEDIVVDDAGQERVVERISLRGTAAVNGGLTQDGNETVSMLRASAIADLRDADQLGRMVAAELLDLGAGALSGTLSGT
jgi:hydroxymethylbilane synthase